MALTNSSITPAINYDWGDCYMKRGNDASYSFWFQIILAGYISVPLAAAGVGANIIIIIVFYRQGPLSNSCTLSLMALAVADLFCCFFKGLLGVFMLIMHLSDLSNYRWCVYSVLVFMGSRPFHFFSQLTCSLTTFTAVERAVSVILPFKVKTLFTPKKSLLFIVSLFVVMFVLYVPNNFEWLPVMIEHGDPMKNYSRLGYRPTKGFPPLWSRVYYILCGIVLRIVSLTIVVVCNILIVWRVKQSQGFRKTAAQTTTTTEQAKSNNPGISSKEMNLINMVRIVCIVFTICYGIESIYSIIVSSGLMSQTIPGDLDTTIWNFTTLLVAVNSTVNFIIYIKMSSRFRAELQLMFNGKQSE